MLSRVTTELMALALRRTPWEAGRWRLVRPALGGVQAHLPGDRYRTIRTRAGFRMRVRPGDWLGRHVFATGEYEPPTGHAIAALLRRGDTFVDAGANVGYFTLLASRRVGPAGRVLAFEPMPATREGLTTNVRLNVVGNVEVRAEALSDRAGEAEFHLGPADHLGTSSLRALADGSGCLRVRTARLDDLLPRGVRVNLVKIDVEGAEYLALQGMRGCLERDRPDLVIEVTDKYLRGLGHTAAGLCGELFDRGYRMFEIDHPGLRPIGAGGELPPGQFNALFTARPELPKTLTVLAATATAAGPR